MWRTPPRQVEAVTARMVETTAVLLGFGTFLLIGHGLPPLIRFAYGLLTLLPPIGQFFIAIRNPKDRMQARYAREMANALPPGPSFLVNVFFRREKDLYASDCGLLYFEAGCLRFQGLRTGFSLPAAHVKEVRNSYEGSSSALKLITEFGVEKIFLDIFEETPKAKEPTLNEAFRAFRQTPSSGDLVPPPTSPPPRSGKRFPGWQRLVFWSVIYLAVVGQAAVLQWHKQGAELRILVHAFAGTLTVALAVEVYRLVRICRSPLEEVPLPILAETSGSLNSLPNSTVPEVDVPARQTPAG